MGARPQGLPPALPSLAEETVRDHGGMPPGKVGRLPLFCRWGN